MGNGYIIVLLCLLVYFTIRLPVVAQTEKSYSIDLFNLSFLKEGNDIFDPSAIPLTYKSPRKNRDGSAFVSEDRPKRRNRKNRSRKRTRQQKRARMLGEMLMRNADKKLDTEDSSESEEQYFSETMVKDRFNWDVFLTDDGPSIMELLAVNARHKRRRKILRMLS